MRFNFCEKTNFKKPMVAPLISVYALKYLQSQRHDFSADQIQAFDALVAHLPTQHIKMRTSTRKHDAPMHEISTYTYDEYDDPDEYYDSDKLMVCLCVPGPYSATLDPVYDATIDQHFTSTPQGMGWNIAAVVDHLETLSDLCCHYDVTFNCEYIETVVEFQKKIGNGAVSIHELNTQDYACTAGVVLYSPRRQAYFAAVVHNSTRTSALLGAEIFPTEEIALRSVHHHDKKDEWVAVPAQVHLNGSVPTEDPVLNEALNLAQKMRMANQLLEEENARLRAQLGLDERPKRLKM